MKKIYLLVFFYLLKIDFCGSEEIKDKNVDSNNSLISDLINPVLYVNNDVNSNNSLISDLINPVLYVNNDVNSNNSIFLALSNPLLYEEGNFNVEVNDEGEKGGNNSYIKSLNVGSNNLSIKDSSNKKVYSEKNLNRNCEKTKRNSNFVYSDDINNKLNSNVIFKDKYLNNNFYLMEENINDDQISNNRYIFNKEKDINMIINDNCVESFFIPVTDNNNYDSRNLGFINKGKYFNEMDVFLKYLENEMISLEDEIRYKNYNKKIDYFEDKSINGFCCCVSREKMFETQKRYEECYKENNDLKSVGSNFLDKNKQYRSELQKKIYLLAEELKKLKKEYELNLSKLNTLYSCSQEENGKKEKNIQELEKNVKNLNKKIKEKEDVIKEKEKKESSDNVFIKEIEKKNIGLENDKENLNLLLNKVCSEYKKKDEDFKNLKKNYDSLIHESQEDIKNYTKKQIDLVVENKNKKNDVKKLNTEIKKKNKEIEEQTITIKNLIKEKEKINIEKNILEEQVVNFSTQVEKLTNENKDLIAQKESLFNQKTVLVEEKNKIELEKKDIINTSENKENENKMKVDNLNEENKKLKEKIEMIENREKGIKEENSQLKENMMKIENNHNGVILNMQETINSLLIQVNQLTSENSIRKQTEDHLRIENNRLLETNLNLIRNNNDLNNKYNENLKELKQEYGGFISNINIFFEDYYKNISEYEQKISLLNNAFNSNIENLENKNIQKVESLTKEIKDDEIKKTSMLTNLIQECFKAQNDCIKEMKETYGTKLNNISSLYNKAVEDWKKQYEDQLGLITEQFKEYKNMVEILGENIKILTNKQSTDEINNIDKLTRVLKTGFENFCNVIDEQKKQFYEDITSLSNNFNETLTKNENNINDNNQKLENKINIELAKITTGYNTSNIEITKGFTDLGENIKKWSEEKKKLVEKINELEENNKNLYNDKNNLSTNLKENEMEKNILTKTNKDLVNKNSQILVEIRKIWNILKKENGNADENIEENPIVITQLNDINQEIKELYKIIKHKEALLKENIKEKNEKSKKILELNKELSTSIETLNNVINKEYDNSFKIFKELLLNKTDYNNSIEENNKNKENKQKKIEVENIKQEIEKIKVEFYKKLQASQNMEVYRNKNIILEEQLSELKEQSKCLALGYDIKAQQEYDHFLNQTQQNTIMNILNDASFANRMRGNSDNKENNEILKEEYYLPFIFEDYNVNNKWFCIQSFYFYTDKNFEKEKSSNMKGKVLKENEIVCNQSLIYKKVEEVLFENLEKWGDFKEVNLKEIASTKVKIEEKTKPLTEENVNVNLYENYSIFIRGNKNEILLGKFWCDEAVKILKFFPDTKLFLIFIGNDGYFYLEKSSLQKIMEYCAFNEGCSQNARIRNQGEYLSMSINNIVTGGAAIERDKVKYFTKKELQSIFSLLFSNRWFKGRDIGLPSNDGDFIPQDILSYPELLIKPLYRNAYSQCTTIEKKVPHLYIDEINKRKELKYNNNTVFWYKCDMQDPITYLLSECIGLGNYGYIGRFYKKDGQGNYFPVALKLTIDSAIHEGGSQKAIMKEIKAGKAAAVMGCNRMIYANKAALIKLDNPNFIKNINENNYSNMFLNPLQFVEKQKKMKNNDDFKKLLLAKKDPEERFNIYYRERKVLDEEKWNNSMLKTEVDYEYRINFLKKRFNNFYNNENFKKFKNLMFNETNKVENQLLYVMEMDIIDEKDEDLYTETTGEIIQNDKENEKIEINDNIKNTIKNIADYLTVQDKCKVIHGDIKAKNMTKNKFLDFGSFDIVTNYETNTEFSEVVGTPEYWDLVRIFNKKLDLVNPYDVLLDDYQLSDLYASFVSLYYYIFKEYPAFATLIIIIKSILKHYINDIENNKVYCSDGYKENIEDFIQNFPIGKDLVKCTKAFEKEKKIKKQTISKKTLEGEENEFLKKFYKYLKDVEDKNYLKKEVLQLRYCIYNIIQSSLLTIADTKKKEEDGDKDKLFFIMSNDKNFYSNMENNYIKVEKFTGDVVGSLIEIYKKLREQELVNIKKLIDSIGTKNNMLGRIMYQILQQGTFANSEKYPAFEVYKNEHSFNKKIDGFEDYRRTDLTYKNFQSQLIEKFRKNVDKEAITNFFNDNTDFKEDYETRLDLQNNSYMYTLEPLNIKSLIVRQAYYQYENSFINIIN